MLTGTVWADTVWLDVWGPIWAASGSVSEVWTVQANAAGSWSTQDGTATTWTEQ